MTLSPEIIDRTLATKHGEAAYIACEKLADAGYKTWWVGGAVRDMLLGNIPREIDIATSATPEEVLKLFRRADDTSAALGAVVISQKGTRLEITTLREDDAASDGRHPESITFTTDQRKDARRRDFTVSAMYFNPLNRELNDHFDGQKDLSERLVRFIGEPKVKIEHDALRILRAIRLRATIDGQYDPATYKALQLKAEMVNVLSGTRQREELEKMLLCPKPDRALRDLAELGILQYILPEMHACKGVAQPKDYHREGDVFEHSLKAIGSFTDDHGIDVRLATLFHDCGKPQTFSVQERIRFDHHAEVSADLAKKVLDRLQMDAKRRDKICWLIRHHMMMGTFADLTDERKAHWYYHPWFIELLQLFWLDIAGTEPADYSMYDQIIDDYDAFLDAHPRPPKPLLKGDEIMELLGIGPGEAVGKAIQALHDAQVRKIITTKKEAINFLKGREK